jgi:hypothetical protein
METPLTPHPSFSPHHRQRFPKKKKKNAQNQRKSNLRKEQEKHQNPRFWIPDPGDRHPASLGSIQGEPQTMVG